MTPDEQIRKHTVDRLDGAMRESRQVGGESREPENGDLRLRREHMLATVVAQELRIRDLLKKLDTATRLRLLLADDDLGEWSTTDRLRRS